MKVRVFDYLVAYLIVFIIILFGSLRPLNFSGLISIAVVAVVPSVIIGTLTNIIKSSNKIND